MFYVKIELPFMCEENRERAEADIRDRLARSGEIPGWQWSPNAEVTFERDDKKRE